MTRASYTDTLVGAIVRDAEGLDIPKGQAAAVAAVEAVAGLWSRAFASAEVDGTDALTPGVLGCIGRDLIRCGESLHAIKVERDGVTLAPAGSWDVFGGHLPVSWRYQVELIGPSLTMTRTLPSAAVLHCRWASSPSRPWIGEGPLESAGLSAELLSALETRLGQEAAAPSALVIPSPVDGGSTTTEQLRADLRTARGGVAMVETMQGGYGDRGGAPQQDWAPKRIGANPPDVLRALRTDLGRAVPAACGIPPDLIEAGSDSAGQREAYRRWLWSSVVPVGRLVAAEATDKLDATARLGFEGWGRETCRAAPGATSR